MSLSRLRQCLLAVPAFLTVIALTVPPEYLPVLALGRPKPEPRAAEDSRRAQAVAPSASRAFTPPPRQDR